MKVIPAAMDRFKGKRATVVGLAREGLALTRFLVAHGAQVTVSDAKGVSELAEALSRLANLPVRLSLGANREEDTVGADMVFVSPGVPPGIPCLAAARRAGVPISSATRLLLQMCPSPIVGVTGSSGKSTTTTLIGEMLRAAGRRVFVGGNLGTPLLERLPEMDEDSWVVLELSSFQLEDVEESPYLAVITNIQPDHLDRHPSMDAYISAKARIFLYQQPQDLVILNYDDEVTRSMSQGAPSRVHFLSQRARVRPGAFLAEDRIVLALDDTVQEVCRLAEVKLRGHHNLYNLMAASLAAALCGVEPAVISRIATTFTGLEHRLEPVGQVKGIAFYNDSIATTPDRAMAALDSFAQPIWLVAGGRDKHLPLNGFAKAIVERCRGAVLYGEGGEALEQALSQHVQGKEAPAILRVGPFAEAVERAASLAQAGEVVLLAPGFASFDQFSSYEERGQCFKELVRRLGGG
jgi:UDP-N-acetylmuramoylalanine--D-glutamate ligase